MLGLVALAALMAMAFVGAGSAMAAAHLCASDKEECASQLAHVHETSVGKAILLASPKVECNVLFLGDVEEVFFGEGEEESEEGKTVVEGNFTYSSCTSGCTVSEQSASSVLEVERTGHETAEVIGEGEVHVNCTGINCYYNREGLVGTAKGALLATQKNGEVSLQEQTLHKVKGTFCPSTAKLDITTTPLETVYISTGAVPEAQNILLKPIQNGGMCPENAGRVVFTTVGETCEYYLKNENAVEGIEVRKIELGVEAKCVGILNNCIKIVTPANVPQCKEAGVVFAGTRLAVGGVCYVKLEYKWKTPTLPSLSMLEIETRSTLRAVATVRAGQSLN
ncbi:MAG TPA: hypothetical protein VFJ64_10455 [Solirubrobacterales bacterium]|nr:hypothetical protein [Solirubrobacterales bacterium]